MLDEYLEQFRGKVAESGTFTVNVAKARIKLRQYLLRERHTYACHLVAAGIAWGASEVRVENDADDLVVEFDGPGFSVHTLENPFGPLLDPETAQNAGGRELAIGLNTALSFDPRWVNVSSRGLALWLHGERQEVVAAETGPGVRIHIKERTSWRTLKKVLSRSGPPEAAAIRWRMRYSPVPILINQERIDGPCPLDRCLARLTTHSPGTRVGPVEGTFGLHLEEEGEFSAEIALTDLESFAKLIFNGFVYEAGPVAGVRAMVAVPHLQRDLSQEQLRHSPALSAVLSFVEQAREKLVEHCFANFDTFDAPWRAQVRSMAVARLESHFEQVRDLPLFELVDGSWTTARKLRRQTYLRYWADTWPGRPRLAEPVVVADHQVRPFLVRWFGERLFVAEREHKEAMAAHLRRLRQENP
ncbi:MAG: hypothetical protein KC910_09700 [Candidatus Eremiobacteraeota bacterium]|nr:hypothetical protein [Candidatus Eremiobacteraeota bacterium]